MKPSVCFTCIGTGESWSPYRRTIWPCPNCEGWPHPEEQPALLRPARARRAVDRKDGENA